MSLKQSKILVIHVQSTGKSPANIPEIKTRRKRPVIMALSGDHVPNKGHDTFHVLSDANRERFQAFPSIRVASMNQHEIAWALCRAASQNAAVTEPDALPPRAKSQTRLKAPSCYVNG